MKHKSVKRILEASLYMLCLCMLRDACSEEIESGAWSVSGHAPVIQRAEPAAEGSMAALSTEGTLGQDYCAMWLHFYQNILSVVVASRCPMLPSCSRIDRRRPDGNSQCPA